MKTAYTLIILMMLGFFAMANSVMANETVDNVVNGVKEAPLKLLTLLKVNGKKQKSIKKIVGQQVKLN